MRKSAQPKLQRRRRKLERRKKKALRKLLRNRRRTQARLRRMGNHSERHAVRLKAPKYFAMLQHKSHRDLVRFLRRLCMLTLRHRRVVCIDFRETKKFYSDGAILFYAELERILSRYPNSVRCFLPKDAIAKQVLYHIGALKKMGCSAQIPSDRDDVIHWTVHRGVLVDATKGVGQSIAALDVLSRNQVAKLFRSVSEALTNVTQHAYTSPRLDGTGTEDDRGWWMFIRKEKAELTVMFCDLGLGVPHTVPLAKKHEGWFRSRLQSAMKATGLASHKDGETIQVTVEEKRSRFLKEHRGNGFGNMLETISSAGRGYMNIYSNRGAYQYRCDQGEEQHQAYNYPDSIFGTVVGWTISLPGGSE